MTARPLRLLGGALAGLLVIPLLQSCGFGGGGGTVKMTAYFPKTVSLYKAGQVRVLGLPAGTVSDVTVQGDVVRVDLKVKKSVTLPEDVQATLVPQSLLGERYILLYPAWVSGQPRLDVSQPSQRVIPLERTSIPVEPDEALAQLKRFLDTLDPNATGRLINNLNEDLNGNGQTLNDALKGLAGVTSTLADKDQQLASLIDNLDRFTTTVDTREAALGQVMDLFAQTTTLLRQERGDIASLVQHLADTATNALDLVNKHAPRLKTDLDEATVLLQSLDANINSVSQLLSSAPTLVAGADLTGKTSGLVAAYNPKYHRIDLRTQLSPTVNGLLQALGLPVCVNVPLLGGASCPPGISPASAGATTRPTVTPPGGTAGSSAPAGPASPATPAAGSAGPAGPTTPTAPTTAPTSPLSGIFRLLGSGGTAAPADVAYGLDPRAAPAHHRGLISSLAHWSRSLLEKLW
jgi:phospholipid/cholesterol/gamma-HCH transport system substrate-binding protein